MLEKVPYFYKVTIFDTLKMIPRSPSNPKKKKKTLFPVFLVMHADSIDNSSSPWVTDKSQAFDHRQTPITVFVPLAAQGSYQSHFRWALIKTLIS